MMVFMMINDGEHDVIHNDMEVSINGRIPKMDGF